MSCSEIHAKNRRLDRCAGRRGKVAVDTWVVCRYRRELDHKALEGVDGLL